MASGGYLWTVVPFTCSKRTWTRWLVGLLAWLVIASRDTISRIVIVTLTTFAIGIAGTVV